MRTLIFAVAMMGGVLSASAQQLDLNCADFLHSADGSWTPTRPITVAGLGGASVTVSPGAHLQHGLLVSGVDLADQLDAQCH